jgi:integrase
LDVALTHFESAEASFVEGRWEAANAQVRSYIDAVFEGVAAIVLNVALKGGHARQRLEDSGILSEKDAGLVKSFAQIAHERGSHPGQSTELEAASRRLAGMGVALIGLKLIPDLVRIEDIFAATLTMPTGASFPRDADMVTDCPTCGQQQSLAEGRIARHGDEMEYLCKNGCQRIAIVGLPGPKPWARPRVRKIQAGRRRFLDQIEKGLRPAGSKTSLKDYLLTVWFPEVEATRRPGTIRSYRCAVREHIIPILGDVRLGDLGREEIRALHQSLADTPPMAKLCHAVLSSAMTHAVRDLGLLARNPCTLVRPPKVTPKETRHLDPAQARRMLRQVRGDRLEPAVILGLAGGLRIGEVCGLTWSDVDLEAATILVRQSWWGPTKSGKPRTVTLPAVLAPTLRKWKLTQAKEMLALGVAQDGSDHIVTDPAGDPLDPGALRRHSVNSARSKASTSPSMDSATRPRSSCSGRGWTSVRSLTGSATPRPS